ncbi:hypothetical protein NHH03_06615 [Stieleria sp. TO1_6]|uniref:hypothetical protein n=1 Tax=Stieleria tagensis TaxID=2956795 RepID=UPI00209B0497|nr:hypothetical protein [Stieleria tagensis]MCO8121403.1 hypothetical protein [Stieleria tagensis]
MSTSSQNPTPSKSGESVKQVITTNWNEMSSALCDVNRAEFTVWLEQELDQLEADLERFVTQKSRYSGRRS